MINFCIFISKLSLTLLTRTVYITVKVLKLWTLKIITVFVLKMEVAVIHQKDGDGMANCREPDHTVPLKQSDLGQHSLCQSAVSIFKIYCIFKDLKCSIFEKSRI